MKSWRVNCIFGIVLVGIILGGVHAARPASIDTGVKLFNQGKLKQAEKVFKSVLNSTPRDERALDYLTRIAEKRGAKQQSFKYYSRLADQPPEELKHYRPEEVYRYAGILAYQVEEFRRALNYLKKARNLTEQETVKQNINGWIQRARSGYMRKKRVRRKAVLNSLLKEVRKLAERGRLQASISLLQNRQEEYGKADKFQQLYTQLRKRQKFQNWVEQSQQVSADTPSETVKKLLARGRKFFNQKKYKTRVAPYLGRLYFYRGEQLLRRGRLNQAKEALSRSRFLAREPHSETLQELVRIYYELGRYRRANEIVKNLDRKFPGIKKRTGLRWAIWWQQNLIEIIFIFVGIALVVVLAFVFLPLYGNRFLTLAGAKLGDLLAGEGSWPLAAWIYRLFCLPVWMPETSFRNWVTVLENEEKNNELRGILEKRRKQVSLSCEHQLKLGQLFVEAEETRRARRKLVSLLEEWEQLSANNQSELARTLAPIWLNDGETGRALELFKKLLELNPDQNKLYQRVLRLAAIEKNWEYWRELGKKWIRRIKSGYIQSEHRATISRSVEENGLQDPESISEFLLNSYDENRELEFTEESTEQLKFLLELATEKPGEESRELSLLKELITRELSQEDREQYTRRLAELYEDREDLETALKYYRKLLSDSPEDFLYLGKMGRINQQLEKWQEAEECYREVFTYQQDNVQAAKGLQQIGRRYENEDKLEQAEKVYRVILENSHFSRAKIQFRLGVTLYRQGKREEALSVFQEIKHGGEKFKAQVLSFIGRCLVEMGLCDVAYSKLSAVDPDNPELPQGNRHSLHYWLGRAAEGDNRPGEALQHYRKILASDVEFRDVAQRVEKLGNG